MPEAAAPVAAPERVAANLVTSENLTAFNADRLRLDIPKLGEPAAPEPKAEPAAEPAKEEPKAAEPAKEEPKAEPPAKPKNGIQERFSEMAERRRLAEEDAKKAREEAAQARKEAEEARAKLAPPKAPDDPGEEPTLAKYDNDPQKWGRALLEWHDKVKAKAQAEEDGKRRAAETQRTFAERFAKAREEIPDLADRIRAQADLPLHPNVNQEIYELERGPQILLYFAEHRDEAMRINNLPERAQVREMAKLDERLGREKAPAPAAKPEEKKPEVQVSKAPAPISALKGATSGDGTDSKINDKGEFTGTPAEWRALRKAGKLN